MSFAVLSLLSACTARNGYLPKARGELAAGLEDGADSASPQGGDAGGSGDSLGGGDTNAGCTNNTSCGANVCIASTCTSRSPLAGACDESADCQPGLACDGSVCKRQDDTPCVANSECLGACINEVCGALANAGQLCDEDADCAAGRVCDTGTCEPQGGVAIYRSVGAGRTTPLTTGGSNALTVSAGIATFALALPSEVGVGDALLYADDNGPSANRLGFIAGRLSGRQFVLQAVDGALADATLVATDVWSLFRAYTSVGDALIGLENVGITGAFADFDDWVDGKDLVAADQSWHIACYADAPHPADTFAVIDPPWVTSAAHGLRIFTPHRLNEVGVSQRHSGAFDANKFHFLRTIDSGNHILYVSVPFVRLEGLQADDRTLGSSHAMVRFNLADGTGVVSGSILRGEPTSVGFTNAVFASGTGTGTLHLWNNVFVGFSESALGDNTTMAGTTVYFSNNTVYGGLYGVQAIYQQVIARNNIFAGIEATHACFYLGSGSFAGSSHNSCNLDEAPIGPGSLQNVTPLFVDSTSGNFHLAPADTVAAGAGLSLASDPVAPFDYDLDNQSRGALWDLGADQRSP